MINKNCKLFVLYVYFVIIMTIIVRYINRTTKIFNNLDEIFDDNQLNIIYVDCSNIQLKELPKEIGNLINLQEFDCSLNQLKELPLEIINCRNLRYFTYANNEIVMNPIIQRFIDRHQNIKNHGLYNDGQNIHTSSIQDCVKQSIINLLNDK